MDNKEKHIIQFWNDGTMRFCNGHYLRPVDRDVSGHEVNEANRQLAVGADSPSLGNASHQYIVSRQEDIGTEASLDPLAIIQFQRGPIKRDGINGITNEVLLSIVADRLGGFQTSTYRCEENKQALLNVLQALMWLQYRTRNRQQRKVEGTLDI